MPYIGRNHIAGDHTSNFKVLDDISSYTATFNGSSASIVSTADNTIRIPEHRFIQGQRVTYSNGGNGAGNIGGLTNGTAYFITFDTANTFKLATSLANANNNTNINLSSVGTGSSHTLTAAFDGVNTTFKITHGGGSSADIVNSAQLQIAINNVIQKANLDSSYTEGFLVVDSRKIQFKTAPTADDIFWGNIIANTIETFDITDLKIDQFTGDGVTTQYTLSREVPNNQSVMVTLDGVVQHPSDKDTTRAYRILAEKVIEFSSPPPNPCDVQIRHLGFAGAATADVSGFYGRTGNVVLGASDHITTGDITPRNINASGIVTASSFVGNLTGNVSGNLTVGGVLTYEDVTNVDSIGIITARSDIHVGAGLSVVGVSTFSNQAYFPHNVNFLGQNSGRNIVFRHGNTILDFSDSAKAAFGDDDDLEIYHAPAGSVINHGGTGNLSILGSQVFIGYSGGNGIQVVQNGEVELRFNNNPKLNTVSNGIDVTGMCTDDGARHDGDVYFIGGTSGRNAVWDMSDNAFEFADNAKVKFGSSDDFEVYHDGSNAVLRVTGDGDLKLLVEEKNFIVQGTGGHQIIKGIDNGAVELYHNNTKRLETFDNNPFVGISVTNDVVLNGSGDTAYRWAVGGNASSNFKWSMYYANSDGALRLFDNVNSRAVSVWKNNGSIELNYQAGKRFETTNEGATFSTGSSSCVVRLNSNTNAVSMLQAVGNDLYVKAASSGSIYMIGNGNETKLSIYSNGKLATNAAASVDCGVGGLHLYLGDGARNDYSTAADGLIIEKNGTTGLSIDPGSSGTANIYFPNESNHSIASISHNNSTGELRVR